MSQKQPSLKPAKTSELEKQLQDLQSQRADLEAQYARALADYQNLLKQTQKDRADYLQYSNAQLITQLLPILDNLQMAYKHLQDPGLEMIVKQFQQILTDEGIEEIQPNEGDQFDAHLHEALDTVDTDDESKVGLIAETTLVGYKYKEGQVLRHAKVKVYKYPEAKQ